MNAELKDILFLDIETVAIVENYNLLDDRMKAQWARKAGFFRRDEDQTDEELFNTRAGIYAEFGKIVSIAVGMFTESDSGALGLRTKYFTSENEAQLLTEFKQLLEKLGPATRMCAHNGKEFDFPYMSRRMLINSIMLPEALNLSGKKPWEILHLDTLELWKFGDYKHYTSLDLLAAIFNIPTSKGVMDGSQVNEVYYKEKDLKKISVYCVGDVIAVAQLYLRLKGLPLMSEKNITHAENE
ncbi:MAG: 3'-5' exonuclease [Cyclobacteriaceae bacterium]|nr:3'-5' exonuclease [Cyclobacteriaceae bacterium]